MATVRPAATADKLDGKDFFFFGVDDLVDALTGFCHGFFGLFLGAVDFVFASVAALFELAQHVEGLMARLAHGHLALFSGLLRDLDQVLTPLLAHRRNWDATQ